MEKNGCAHIMSATWNSIVSIWWSIVRSTVV